MGASGGKRKRNKREAIPEIPTAIPVAGHALYQQAIGVPRQHQAPSVPPGPPPASSYVSASGDEVAARFMVTHKDTGNACVVAIDSQGVVIETHTGAVIDRYPYQKIVTWGHSNTVFALEVGSIMNK